MGRPSTQISIRGSKRGRRNKRQSIQKPYRNQYFSFWVWSCCGCLQHPRLLVSVTPRCPGCTHPRCEACPVERITMVPSKGYEKFAKSYPRDSDASRMGRLECDVQEEQNDLHELNASQRSGVSIEASLDQSFDSKTISELATAIELDLESHAPNPAREDPNFVSCGFYLMLDSVPIENTTLVSLLPPENEANGLFVLRQAEDAAFADIWHNTVLQSIDSNPEHWDGLNAAHIFRQGPSEEDSRPVILVSTDSDSLELKESLRDKFSQFFAEPIKSSLRISFEQSKVHRSTGGFLPDICEARNTSFQRIPKSGASIGIHGRLDCTATLGGFILVDGRSYILTVDHIVPDDLAKNWTRNSVKNSTISITHPSEQEGHGTPSWNRISDFLETLKACCNACHELWKEHCEETAFYKPIDALQIQCPTATQFRKIKDELFRDFPAKPLGDLVFRSETRSRCSQDGGHQTEMDWALVATNQWAVPLDSNIEGQSTDLHITGVVPSARIRSTGRTSGEQFGQVNIARSIVRHMNPCRFTQEYSVIREPDSTLNEWITGGIGVDGDSGSWVIDRDSGALYGMAWGRDRVKTNPICLFSAMSDIIADIKERTGAQSVCLPGDEAVAPLSSKPKRKESLPIPTSFASRRLSDSGPSQSLISNMVSSKG